MMVVNRPHGRQPALDVNTFAESHRLPKDRFAAPEGHDPPRIDRDEPHRERDDEHPVSNPLAEGTRRRPPFIDMLRMPVARQIREKSHVMIADSSVLGLEAKADDPGTQVSRKR
ncbi:MAG TPA: hypothetical protein VGY13_02775 [Solirubrobacteraceae bacterium]|nr:hypothetical protein [Solirubrobacteraceae bacterium]